MKELRAGATPASLDAPDAVEVAAQALGLDDPAGLRVTESQGAGDAVVSGGGISASPIQAKLGWQPAADGQLRLAWQTESTPRRTRSVDRERRRAHRRAAGFR